MEKIVRDFKIDYELDWTYGVEISKIRSDLDAIEKLGATHVEIEHGVSYDCSYVEIDAIAIRLETDEEYNARIDGINKRQESIKRDELHQLEMLKAENTIGVTTFQKIKDKYYGCINTNKRFNCQ